jgi:hypothetical protein
VGRVDAKRNALTVLKGAGRQNADAGTATSGKKLERRGSKPTTARVGLRGTAGVTKH